MGDYRVETPFDDIDGSLEYVSLLSESIADALAEVSEDIAEAAAENAERRREALQLVHFNLTKLEGHMNSSRRILNDLKTLRRLLLAGRNTAKTMGAAGGF